MKNIKFMSVALLAVTLGLGVASCSSDDDNNDGGGSNEATQKYISRRIFAWEDGTSGSAIVTYDIQNRLTKIEYNVYQFPGVFEIDYNKLTMTGGRVYHFKLNEQGFISEITSEWGEKAEFKYNSSGYLVSSSYSTSSKEVSRSTLSWKNGNLMSESCSDGLSSNFKYGSEVNKGNIQTYFGAHDFSLFKIFSTTEENFADILTSSRLFGNLSHNLPISITNSDEEGPWTNTYSYELDKEGYVTKVVCSGDEPCDIIYIYK